MKQRIRLRFSLVLATLVLNQALLPGVLMALTSGPTQPEVQGFQPIGTSDMVNLFTGDFSYNIPLGEINGYPINLAYSADSRPEDEASWVGLGWSLTPGAINREVRGIPDDFNGDIINKDFNLRDNYTVGGKFNVGAGEVFGLDFLGLQAGVGAYFNNYRGLGLNYNLGPTVAINKLNSSLSLDFAFDTGSGVDFSISPNFGVGIEKKGETINRDINFTTGFNSRQGLKNLSFGVKATHKEVQKVMLKGKGKTLNIVSNGQASGGISFGTFSYVPTSSLPITNESFTFNLKLGPTFFGASGFAGFTGYTTNQSLLTNTMSQPAFGYLHHQDITTEQGLMDYNNGPGVLHRESPHLPITVGTYDLFNVSGHGITGQFRINRTDLGILRPGLSLNTSTAASTAPEIGVGNAFDIGGNFVPTVSESRKGQWFERNRLGSTLHFANNQNTKEAHYFATPGGNPHPLGQAPFAHRIGGNLPIRTDLEQNNSVAPIRALNKLLAIGYDRENQQRTVEEISLTPSSEFVPDQRIKRNQTFSYLTSDEAVEAALDIFIEDYESGANPNLIPRTNRPGHHLSEVTITQSDGRRYVYGTPAYNTRKDEVTFAIELDSQNPTPPIDAPRLAPYDINQDNSITNANGIDNFYDRTQTPEYAHSYLLTAILSDDYIDVTGNGVTDDDLGEAVKFKYRKAHDNFAWRIPFEVGTASFQEGLKSETRDDKASYIYGEKEIWYLDAIEGRTMEARFITCDRRDGLGVAGENGGIETGKPLRKLERIEIYSKSELIKSPSNPTPIKTIHFEYDYSLCPGVPNFANLANCSGEEETGNGKLTLKRVYFTYGKSDRGTLNAYSFNYQNNVNYDLDNINRWGLYQAATGDQAPSTAFPYQQQDIDQASAQAGAWNLDQITLPSGGVINVEYEPDTYAYVQDKRAGQMFSIAGFARNVEDDPIPTLYDKDGDINRFLVIKDINALTIEEALERYLTDTEQLYFKCLTDLTNDGNNKEYVSGYLTYDRQGVQLVGTLSNRQLYIPIDHVSAENIEEVHPITFAGIQLIRFERPNIAYPGYELAPDDSPNISVLLSFIREVGNIFRGFVRQGVRQEWARTIDPTRSWVRLSNPNFAKIGGGTRVKSIRISDEWNITDGDDSSEYGQQYFYDTETYINGKPTTISSGVAAYEPLVGGEENLMRTADTFDERRRLAPNNNYYSELPLGESLYPSPTVGYSKVRIENLDYGQTVKSIGYTEHEFYTAKDFPIVEQIGEVEKLRQNPNPLLQLLRLYNKDELAMSQGISVEVNDMHGKQKAISTYGGFGNLLQSSTYSYRTQTSVESGSKVATGGELKLDNQVQLLQPDGHVVDGTLGYSVDLWQEMKSDGNESITQGVETNGIGIFWAIFPSVTPFPHPVISKDISTLKTSMTTKFIQRFGILDEVTVMENGSTLTTKNVLFDSETGDVLMTETENEFDDKMYNLTYPAHWAYEDMGQAYQNIGAIVRLAFGGNPPATGTAVYLPASATSYLKAGDEVTVLENDDINEVYWVVETPNGLLLSDRVGLPLLMPNLDNDEHLTLKVIRSGFRNQASFPIAAISSKQDPSVTGSLDFSVDREVIDAAATTFGEEQKMRCTEIQTSPGTPMFMPKQVINPYTAGLLGHWQPNQSYVYYGQRTNSTLPGSFSASNSVRTIGTLTTDFSPFWIREGNQYVPGTNEKWTFSNAITLYDQRGNEIENQDALGLYSAAQFGYKENLAVAVANNAAAREMAFDGFEDYSFENETNGTAPFRRVVFEQDNLQGSATIVNDIAHTGHYSMQIAPSDDFELHLEGGCIEQDSSGSMNTFPTAVITPPTGVEYCSTSDPLFAYQFLGEESTDAEDGNNLTYQWRVFLNEEDEPFFTSSMQNISINFDTVGTYTIELVVTDSDGATDITGLIVEVPEDCPASGPPPAINPKNFLPKGITSYCAATTFSPVNNEFTNECCSCLTGLTPLSEKQYLVSFWVATDISLECGVSVDKFSATATATYNMNSNTDNFTVSASGPVIEGWQRYEGMLDLQANLQATDILFSNASNTNNVYIDDFRFHPLNSNMQSYVYDDSSLRLWAVLDENNYATFYEYDDEGLLVRVKRETEKGVMTVQESRTVLQPQ